MPRLLPEGSWDRLQSSPPDLLESYSSKRWIDSHLKFFHTVTFLSNSVCEPALFCFPGLTSFRNYFICSLSVLSVLVSVGSMSFQRSLEYFFSLHSSEEQNRTQMWLDAPKSANSFKVQQMYPSNEDKMYSKIVALRTFVIKKKSLNHQVKHTI